MKFSQSALFLATAVAAPLASAFSVIPSTVTVSPALVVNKSLFQSSSKRTNSNQLQMESDFASAMPQAPELTTRELLEQAADKTISTFRGSLGEGVEPVPELEALCKLRDNDDVTDEQLALGIYELMIERGMTYDENPDNGVLTLTEFDIQANMDTPEVVSEFLYLYRYGMTLIRKGYCSSDSIKDVVQKRLIARTGKTPIEFDAWLGF